MVTYKGRPRAFLRRLRPPKDGPGSAIRPLEPTIAIEADGTQILGTTTVHGNLVLDGTSLQFPAAIPETIDPAPDGDPAIYRIKAAGNDELRIDVGSLTDGDRTLVLGVTKDGQFSPAHRR